MRECSWGGHILEQPEAQSSASARKAVWLLQRSCYVAACMAAVPRVAHSALFPATADDAVGTLPSLLHQEIRTANYD